MSETRPIQKSAAGALLSVHLKPGESDDQAVARYATTPEVGAALSMMNLVRDCRAAPLDSLVEALQVQGRAVNGNDLSRAESMLIAQAHTLDALYNNLLYRAMVNVGEHLDAADRFYRLAMRAQNQCRATLETLATLKNPPSVSFVKQANIGQAVQVNNGPAPPARTSNSGPNELLEGAHERLEHSTPATAGLGNSTVATLGAVNRSKVRSREDAVESQQLQARGKVA